MALSALSLGPSNLNPFSYSIFKSLKLPPFLQTQKVKIGPLSVSPMGFGTWAWGNQLLWGYQESMDNELQQVFNIALENGVNLFDTADSYGTGSLNGQSEKLLGRFIRNFQEQKGSGSDSDIVIATKFAAYPWRLTPGQFVNACRASLERMQIEQIGIGQLHWSTANYAPFQELALWDGLGLVKAVGVSNYGPKQLLKIHDYLKKCGVPLCSAQVQFSLLSMGEDQLEIKSICDSLGIQLIAYSPLGLGMLTGKYSPSTLPTGPRGLLFKQILPGLDPLLSSLRDIANKRRKTMSQGALPGVGHVGRLGGLKELGRVSHGTLSKLGGEWDSGLLDFSLACLAWNALERWKRMGMRDVAINWCICKDTIPIPGVKTIKQVKENLGALGWRLSSEEVLQLEYAAQESPRKMIQNIFLTR
ncbi:hypothetical protein Ahy_B10g103753 isoform A [Arachis hypogaea]|uniref:NADP-dependent oxidoreductase domain-containing protein n=1 Tax=Arachis hypogaea TaxID=3818 RepID=A0A444X429_ARAHY|nr:hypothetical protein Ahy_B10g103753 isoform A [Arachis hypogaea]